MSLTEAERVFGGVTEQGINDLLRAFFTARPRHLVYGSAGFVPSTTVAATQMPAIAFPGVPGGIDWSVELSLPVVDLHPETSGLPPELSLAPGQVSVVTTVRLCMACETRRDREEEERERERERDKERDKERERDHDRDGRWPGKAEGTCCELRIFGVGHLERVFGPDAVIVAVDAVEIVDIEPVELEGVLECLMLQILRAVLADVRLPIEALRAGAFSLALTRGPEVEDDQLKVYGNL